MLLAEINGKPCPEIEGVEDLITSAVFGHLRLINPPVFWPKLFRLARTVEIPSRSLADVLLNLRVAYELYTELEIRFWPRLIGNSEPDLLVRFTGSEVPPLVLIIEVKLNSGKSGRGELDQLARYLATLDDPRCISEWHRDFGHSFILYLTRSFAASDLAESVSVSHSFNAQERMFGLEWNDILEVANEQRFENRLLGEVAEFLKRRGFGRFAGFTSLTLAGLPTGHFYCRDYFGEGCSVQVANRGRFYGE